MFSDASPLFVPARLRSLRRSTSLFAVAVACGVSPAAAQTALPGIVVPAPPSAKVQAPKTKRVASAPTLRAAPVRSAETKPLHAAAPLRSRAAIPLQTRRLPAPALQLSPSTRTADAPTPSQQQAARLDRTRDALFPRAGASATDIGQAGIAALPGGSDQSLDKVLLQLPGVTQDSAASGNFHVRNEHANVQVRINGIMLPEGISGFGQFLETSFVGNLALLTGALPAQYGLRTSGIIDITSRAGAFDGGGAVNLYGGSRGTVTPSVEYGGTRDGWSWFVTGRALANRQAIENPAATFDPIHDRTDQGRYFAYLTKDIDATTRLSFISGAYSGRFQIPNAPGQTPAFTAFGIGAFDSRTLNETQTERSTFNVLALQTSTGALDLQLSAFSRTGSVRFKPDGVGDLLFNGNATDVFRSSIATGVQADGAYHIDPAQTVRFGLTAITEHTRVVNAAIVLPTDASGDQVDAPFGIVDRHARTGYTLGTYVQHEWRIAPTLTLNTGLRFDQSWSETTTNQVSPRTSLVWQPIAGTTLHAGYARYFTPPSQGLASRANVAAFTGTTLQPDVATADAVRPERAHYFDAGIEQAITPRLKVGIDAYHKRTRNLLDDGQFGAALVLNAFNYARGYNTGVELKAIYEDADLRAYANLAWGRQRATQVSSNQYLFGADELAYIARNYVYTDHAQTLTASAGANLRVLERTRLGFDLVYGSGLRSGFTNTTHLNDYAQINLGATHEWTLPGLNKPTTLRFDVVNLLDHTYLIRDGSGIGVFAPQYGQRRGFYAGLTQRF